MKWGSIIVVDVGSTTTKALRFSQKGNQITLVGHGEAPTTVEAPFEDVVAGVIQSVNNLLSSEKSPIQIGNVKDIDRLAEAFLVTSSAGGGLQLVVCGNLRQFTAESAQRAALGAGAVLLDVFAADDGWSLFARMERLRQLRPDMILLSGGIEGAQTINSMVEMCDSIRMAYHNGKSKFGYDYRIPIVYAGNSGSADMVRDLVGEDFDLQIVPNLCPSFNEDNFGPTREAIHELFIDHVMAHAPGYPRLLEAASVPILPTPVAVGKILQLYAKHNQENILCVDIGGATTDMFSVFDGHYSRTVSANYGMSYSVGNVLATAGVEQVARWLPFPHEGLTQSVGNKMLYPTSIPETIEELIIEQALAREALRLSLKDHMELAYVQSKKPLLSSQPFGAGKRTLELPNIDLIIGSGGVLSHAPLRGQCASMLIDAFEPVGVTRLAVDSIFMLPHIGAISEHDQESALNLLDESCLVSLGTCIAPYGKGLKGLPGCRIWGKTDSGREISLTITYGEMNAIPLGSTETADVVIAPTPPLDIGLGPGIPRGLKVRGGEVGIIVDLRGRPLDRAVSQCDANQIGDWLRRLDAWPSVNNMEVAR